MDNLHKIIEKYNGLSKKDFSTKFINKIRQKKIINKNLFFKINILFLIFFLN